jgi:hypothetical protein
MIINAREFIKVCSAVTKCPAHAIYLEATPGYLQISTRDLRGSTGIKIPWIEPPTGKHTDAWQVPIQSLKRLAEAFTRPDRDDIFVITGDSDRIRIEYACGHVNLNTISHNRFSGTQELAIGNVPSVVLPVRSMRFVLSSALGFTDTNSQCETFTTTCIELVVRTPAGSYRQGVSASVPIQSVSLRATGSDGARLGLFECPVDWESLADMVAFRAVARDDLRWGLGAVVSFAGGVGKRVRMQFLDFEHGLRISDPEGTWFVNVPWSPLTYFNYVSAAASIPEAIMVQSLGAELSTGSALLSTLQPNDMIVFQDNKNHIAMVTSSSDAAVLQTAIEATRVALEHHYAPKPNWLVPDTFELGAEHRVALPVGWSTQNSKPSLPSPAQPSALPVCSTVFSVVSGSRRTDVGCTQVVRNHGLYMAPVTQRLQGYRFEAVGVPQEALRKTTHHFRASSVEISIPASRAAGMRMQLRHTGENGFKSLAVIAVKA